MTSAVAEVLGIVLTTVRGSRVERLTGTYPADDDNLWYVKAASSERTVQVESGPEHALPFLIEGDDTKVWASTVVEAVSAITSQLAPKTDHA